MQKLIEGNNLNLSYILKISSRDSNKDNPIYAAQVIQLPGIFLQGTLEDIKRDASKATEKYLQVFPEELKKLKNQGNKPIGLSDSGYGIIIGFDEFSVDISKIYRG